MLELSITSLALYEPESHVSYNDIQEIVEDSMSEEYMDFESPTPICHKYSRTTMQAIATDDDFDPIAIESNSCVKVFQKDNPCKASPNTEEDSENLCRMAHLPPPKLEDTQLVDQRHPKDESNAKSSDAASTEHILCNNVQPVIFCEEPILFDSDLDPQYEPSSSANSESGSELYLLQQRKRRRKNKQPKCNESSKLGAYDFGNGCLPKTKTIWSDKKGKLPKGKNRLKLDAKSKLGSTNHRKDSDNSNSCKIQCDKPHDCCSDGKMHNREMCLKHGDERNDEKTHEDGTEECPSIEAANQLQNAHTTGIVVRGHSSSKDHRVYDKRFHCLYCERPQAKLPRHLESQHKDKKEVQQWLCTRDKRERENMLIKLRHLGNHLHNQKVYREGKGEVIVVYRPKDATAAHSYLPCEHCLGYYAKRDLWKHVSRCNLNSSSHAVSDKTKQKKKCHISRSRMLLPLPGSSPLLKEVLDSMRNDAVGMAIKGDFYIKKYGEQLVLRHGHKKSQHCYIRNTLRELGSLLIDLRKTGSFFSLKDYLKTTQFQALVRSTKTVAGFNQATNTMKTPSLVLKLGASLSKCALLMKADALQEDDEEEVKNAQGLADLLSMRWSIELSSNALRTMHHSKQNSIKLLPLSSDVKKLSDYLKEEISSASSLLKEDFTNVSAYHRLKNKALALIIIFNRRRSGEASRMTLAHYHTRGKSSDDHELGLSPLEKTLASSLQRVEIIGKRGRLVPMILTPLIQDALNLLVSCRESVGISQENQYMFPNTNGLSHVRGSDVVRENSVKCGAERPEALRSTNLRKHIATMMQLLNLKDNELDILANFMGHDIRVHREFYRLPEHTNQLAKVSKLLLTIEDGNVGSFQGKPLDEIDVNLDEILEVAEQEDIQDSESEQEVTECGLGDNSIIGDAGQLEGVGQKCVSIEFDGSAKLQETHEESLLTNIQEKYPVSKIRKVDSANNREEASEFTDGKKKTLTRSRGKPVPWSREEIDSLKAHFTTQIQMKSILKKEEICEFLRTHPSVDREWKLIKYKVRDLANRK